MTQCAYEVLLNGTMSPHARSSHSTRVLKGLLTYVADGSSTSRRRESSLASADVLTALLLRTCGESSTNRCLMVRVDCLELRMPPTAPMRDGPMIASSRRTTVSFIANGCVAACNRFLEVFHGSRNRSTTKPARLWQWKVSPRSPPQLSAAFQARPSVRVALLLPDITSIDCTAVPRC